MSLVRRVALGCGVALALAGFASADTVDGKAVLSSGAELLQASSPDQARMITNYLRLFSALGRSPTITVSPVEKGDLTRVIKKANDIATDEIVKAVGVAVGALIGKTAGGVVTGMLTPTPASPCSDLPDCNGHADTACVVRFVADTDPVQFASFVSKQGCAASLAQALQ